MWVGALDNTVVDKAKYLEALAKDPVALGHDIIHIIHLSGQHRKGFHDTIINGNANKELLRPCPTPGLIRLLWSHRSTLAQLRSLTVTPVTVAQICLR